MHFLYERYVCLDWQVFITLIYFLFDKRTFLCIVFKLPSLDMLAADLCKLAPLRQHSVTLSSFLCKCVVYVGTLQDPGQKPCRILCRYTAGSCAGILQDHVRASCRICADFLQDPVQASCRILCRRPAGSCAGILQDHVQASCRIPCGLPAGSCADILQMRLLCTLRLQGAKSNSAGLKIMLQDPAGWDRFSP